MKNFGTAIIALSILLISFSSCDKDDNVTTIDVRGLFSLTGNWSSLGITSESAIELAADDINDYLSNKDADFRLRTSTADTKLDTALARSLFLQAADDDIRFIIGPQSSAELQRMKPAIDNAEVIVISQSSTAGSLAIPGDAIFRFCPSDKIEGAAIANTIYNSGIQGLVLASRDDPGNNGLHISTGLAFTAKGGSPLSVINYLPETTDFTGVVAALKNGVLSLAATHGMEKVGVYLASFDEGTEIMKLAAADPILSNVKWFGGDGVVLSTAFINDPVVAEFVIKTSFFAPSFGLPVANESQWKPVADRIKAQTGVEPDAFALAAYDAMWTIAYTIEANNGSTDNFEQLKTLFIEQANTHSGIIGAGALDAAGDRATGTFDYFSIVKEGDVYVWKLVGKSDG